LSFCFEFCIFDKVFGKLCGSMVQLSSAVIL